MSGYKRQILERLVDNGWERLEEVDVPDWWAEDCWKMRSIRESWGLEIFLTFLIDPQWDQSNTDQPEVWAIIATETFPEVQNPNDQIAHLARSSRGFEFKLKEFIATVNDYQRDLRTNTE